MGGRSGTRTAAKRWLRNDGEEVRMLRAIGCLVALVILIGLLAAFGLLKAIF